ncbi:hypothetical protein GCM10010176_100520 [Nonomuraea spiralis]|nr:hypothetical protein GCM10010176_100520 [Nonomuraea spiralis]
MAHNLRFDLGFLQDEFGRAGSPIPRLDAIGICTMTEALRYLPAAPRTLAGCCAVADIPLDGGVQPCRLVGMAVGSPPTPRSPHQAECIQCIDEYTE